MKANIGKILLKLVAKHFPRQHKYHTLFNKNSIKVSYSCMESMGDITRKHNKKILSSNNSNDNNDSSNNTGSNDSNNNNGSNDNNGNSDNNDSNGSNNNGSNNNSNIDNNDSNGSNNNDNNGSNNNGSNDNGNNDNNNDIPCNCRNPRNCPLDNKCLTKSLIYNAQVTSTSPPNQTTTKNYIGLTETTFKTRYAGHKSSFKHRDQSKSTELSKYIWQLKDNNINFNIKWSIIARAQPYNNSSKRCDLCSTEKLYIIKHSNNNILNKRSEMVSKCRHENKFYLQKS